MLQIHSNLISLLETSMVMVMKNLLIMDQTFTASQPTLAKIKFTHINSELISHR